MKKSRKGIKDKCHIENLDRDKLQELIDSGREYRYTEFCPKIGLERLQGDSKIKQLNELGAICEYEKNKTKFKFIKMRSEEEIVLYNERSKYIPIIEYLLIEFLLDKNERGECEGGIYYFTTPQSLLQLGMVNENFALIHSSPHKWECKNAAVKYHHTDFNMRDINTFMTITYRNILKPIIRDSFKSIDNKRGIIIQRGYKVFLQTDDMRSYRNILVTSREGQMLTSITAQAMEEVGIESMDTLYTMPTEKIKLYYSTCDRLCKEQVGYDGFYDCYALSINEERLRKIHNWNYYSAQKELNRRTIGRVETAKQLEQMSTKSKNNLIDAVIDIETQYNFQSDYERFMDERKKK